MFFIVCVAFGKKLVLPMPMAFTITDLPPPQEHRVRRRRLVPEIRALRPGQSLTADFATAICAVQFFRRQGWRCTTTRLPRRQMQVWILKGGATK